jgi:hypothetical protein
MTKDMQVPHQDEIHMLQFDAMATAGTINFPNQLGSAKRRRMRSGGGVSTATNNTPKDQEKKPDSKCKGGQTIPIFLKSK